MKYLLTMVLALIISVPASAQRQHGKRTHDKTKVERVVKGEKECKCVCHKSKKTGHAKRGKHGDRKRGDRKRGDRRRGQDRKRGKATNVKSQRINRFRKLMEARKGTKHGFVTK
jgi:hypothetical protein